VAGFTPDNRGVWLLSIVEANAARLLGMDVATGATTLLAGDSVFDAAGILVHPTRRTLQAVQFTRQRLEWQAIDSAMSADLRRSGACATAISRSTAGTGPIGSGS
jgi:hypothetical protein